jgi:hypothetical protein
MTAAKRYPTKREKTWQIVILWAANVYTIASWFTDLPGLFGLAGIIVGLFWAYMIATRERDWLIRKVEASLRRLPS